jgi:hypothetical protein
LFTHLKWPKRHNVPRETSTEFLLANGWFEVCLALLPVSRRWRPLPDPYSPKIPSKPISPDFVDEILLIFQFYPEQFWDLPLKKGLWFTRGKDNSALPTSFRRTAPNFSYIGKIDFGRLRLRSKPVIVMQSVDDRCCVPRHSGKSCTNFRQVRISL